MIGTIVTDKEGKIANTQSSYQPSTAVKNFTKKVKQDYQIGHEIQNRPFREFNDLSVLQVMDRDQKLFNTYVEAGSTDPDEDWRYTGRRPLARNKLISLAAHATASLLVPKTFAQNSADEEDKDSAEVMRDLLEYHIRNSDYEMSFLFGVISGLVNPAVYMETTFVESLIEIKEKDAKGHITRKEVVDDVLSGLKVGVVPVDEIFITNAYEYEIQRQRALGRRKWIDYDEAFAKYGKHENFKYVQPGVKVFLNEADNSFYEQKDDNLATLAEEFTYYNRREDCEVCYVNGIYMGEVNPEDNMMRHRDSENRPKYQLAKSGYEPIDEKRFHYYKSGASKLFEDDKLMQTMWAMRMDLSMLMGFPPVGVAGGAAITSNIMVPGITVTMPPETKFTPLTNGGRPDVLDGAIMSVERSMTESSADDQRGGIDTKGSKTAYETQKIEQNARIQLGLFGKMIARLTEDVGYLIIDDIIQHETVGEAQEILNGETKLKFKSFLLPNQTMDGRNVTKKIVFTDKPAPEDPAKYGFDLMEKEGGLESDKRIYEVNPEEFRKRKFKLFVSADDVAPKNDVLERALAAEDFNLMRGDPYFDQMQIRKTFVESRHPGEGNKYLSKNPPPEAPMQAFPGASQEPKGDPTLASQINASGAAKSARALSAQ